MSTNPKNIIRKEFLKNFTKKVKTRFVLFDKYDKEFGYIYKTISRINSEVNIIIQKLNLKIIDRQLPYINLLSYFGDVSENGKVRVFLHKDDTNHFIEHNVKTFARQNSHILDLLVTHSYNKITISDLSCDAQLVINKSHLVPAIVDILLDIIMFNSYSFLKELDLDEKKKFSVQKYELYKSTDEMTCFYECPDENLSYFSLAFSARKGIDSFDIDGYVEYWNDMISKFYPNCTHKEKSVKEQLNQHVDRFELPKNLYEKIEKLQPGAYLILRTNRDRTEDIHPQLYSIFGIKPSQYRHGLIKIVDIGDFEQYVPLLEHLDVSAFKIVVPSKEK